SPFGAAVLPDSLPCTTLGRHPCSAFTPPPAPEIPALSLHDALPISGSSAPKAALGALSLVAEGGADAARAAVERSSLLSEVVDIVRDLVNTPPNLLYPASFAQRAQELVADLPVTVTVLDETQLAEGGYGGIVG